MDLVTYALDRLNTGRRGAPLQPADITVVQVRERPPSRYGQTSGEPVPELKVTVHETGTVIYLPYPEQAASPPTLPAAPPDLAALTLPALRAYATSIGVDPKGTKPALLTRLQEHANG